MSGVVKVEYVSFPALFKENQSNVIGEHKLFRFENDYGASVIRGEHTYGGPANLWELAVIRFEDDGTSNICMTTPVTDDVIGWLSWHEVGKLLHQIYLLPPKE